MLRFWFPALLSSILQDVGGRASSSFLSSTQASPSPIYIYFWLNCFEGRADSYVCTTWKLYITWKRWQVLLQYTSSRMAWLLFMWVYRKPGVAIFFTLPGQCGSTMVGNHYTLNSCSKNLHISARPHNTTEGDHWKVIVYIFPVKIHHEVNIRLPQRGRFLQKKWAQRSFQQWNR